ncbi:MAG: cytochrome P450, partial [Pseudomonadota bacterium]
FSANIGGALQEPANQVRAMAILRAFIPNLLLKREVVKSYANTGTAVVTRGSDVRDVLARDADFEVVYGPRMRKLTDGENFFLGMQPGWDYTRDTSAMRLAARTTDVAQIVLPRASARAEEIVAASDGKLDLPPTLTKQVPWDMTDTYFGTGGPDAETMQAWTTTLFWYLFGDLGADPDLDAKSMSYAAGMRDYLDSAVAAAKANPDGRETILNRCLELQGSNTPGMSDLGIRNNLLGLLIGAIPTISKASCLALDELFRQPEGLRRAQAAAREGDDAKLASCIWEALRFNPHNPVVYRRATRDAVIAPGTLRARTIPKGTMVFAASLSAMFDRHDIEDPHGFRTDRRFEEYIIWGIGMHTCFGAAINAAVIPAILKPLLRQKNLRRAEGDAGQVDTGGTPFPEHFTVLFDPE